MKLESEEDRRQSSCITEVREEVWTQKKSLSGLFFINPSRRAKSGGQNIQNSGVHQKVGETENLINVPGNEDSVRSRGQSRRKLEEKRL